MDPPWVTTDPPMDPPLPGVGVGLRSDPGAGLPLVEPHEVLARNEAATVPRGGTVLLVMMAGGPGGWCWVVTG